MATKTEAMTISALCSKAHEMAVEKGWWDVPERSALEIHALIHSEVSEATEAVRNGLACWVQDGPEQKPEGELSEMADIVIRVCDWCSKNDWDLEAAIVRKMAFNQTRGYRHGGKKA